MRYKKEARKIAPLFCQRFRWKIIRCWCCARVSSPLSVFSAGWQSRCRSPPWLRYGPCEIQAQMDQQFDKKSAEFGCSPINRNLVNPMLWTWKNCFYATFQHLGSVVPALFRGQLAVVYCQIVTHKKVIGKSPIFMSLIILSYIFGIIHKALYSHDIVIWLYVFNAVLVATDLMLYFTYIGRNRRELQQGRKEPLHPLIF